MREIKFRAWDGSRMFDIARYDFADNTVYSHLFACEGYLGESLKVMQYTGLKDKNGEEIYEGYLVKWIIESINYPGVFREHICEVFRNKQGAYRLRGKTIYETELCCNRKKVEVIGNIYENPELLEG